MKKIDISQAITILANVGVIAGIVFLAFELRQANRIAAASTEFAIRESYVAFNEMLITDPSVAELYLKVLEPNATLSAVEQIQIRSLMRRLLNTWLAIEAGYENGLVSAETYSTATNEPRQVLSVYLGAKPYMRTIADLNGRTYGSQVMAAVYEILDE